MLRSIALSLTAISLAGCVIHHHAKLETPVPANRQAVAPKSQSRFAWIGRMGGHLVPKFSFHHLKKKDGQPESVAIADGRRAEVRIDVEPYPVSLGDTRRLSIALQYVNITRRFQSVSFPNGQRFEIVIRNSDGKIIAQWSEDQLIEKAPGSFLLNPGEAAEYDTTIATRDMAAGHSYTLEAWFVSDPSLIVRKTIIPRP